MRPLVLAILLLAAGGIHAQNTTQGSVQKHADRAWQAWDQETHVWMDLEAFWVRHAERNGGLTWGRGEAYPPYAKVKEFDTFLVELNQGPCLMQFFHGRWRRANDVQRWDDAFNEFGGCPNVFD